MIKNSPAELKSKFMPTSEIQTERVIDYNLAQKAANGDIEAFEAIYWKYHRRVFGTCMQMTRNAAEAEDVTQKVFILLFRKIGSFRGESSFYTWLHRMTFNQVLMHFRHNKSRKDSPNECGESLEENTTYKVKSDHNQVLERLQLSEAIAQLADGYRRVLILHDIQGFEHEEIARILGCATGTTKSQLHKARRKLRVLLMGETDVSIQKLQEAV